MFAQIRHVAIISENYAQLGKFYEAVFGMRISGSPRPTRAVTVGDGYVGLNINPRRVGRPAGLDHFGLQVEDVEEAFGRLRAYDARIKWVQRPSARPFAGITTHDPEGNVFDLSQQDMENRKDVYVENSWEQERTISHVGVRTLDPEAMAHFYSSVFELASLNKRDGDPNFYLSDGRVTLVLIPWDIGDYLGTGIVAPGIDHIGFKVESVEAVKRDVEEVAGVNHRLAPTPYAGKEGQAWLGMFRKGCPLGAHHLADSDGVTIDISEG